MLVQKAESGTKLGGSVFVLDLTRLVPHVRVPAWFPSSKGHHHLIFRITFSFLQDISSCFSTQSHLCNLHVSSDLNGWRGY